MRLTLVPISIAGACEYVSRWHRHLERPRGAKFAIAAQRVGDFDLCGVAIVGRPKARELQDGRTLEVVRVATPTPEPEPRTPEEHAKSVCSFLYAKARRAAQALGYTSCKTYSLKSEGGASLRALGLTPEATVQGREWDTPSRRRKEGPRAQREEKLRWELLTPEARSGQ